MNCHELREQMDRYVRNELSAEEVAGFESHLSGCAACSALLETEEPALVATASLPRSIEPSADLWPHIRTRLSPRHVGASRRITLPSWALAAAAVLLIVASAGTTALLLHQPPSRQAAEPPSQAGKPPSAGAAELEAQYASATADLVAELAKARSRLDPATLATIERNLRVIDDALAESRRALAGDPNNQVLEQLVVAVWHQKMDFLRRATALAPPS